MEWNNVKMSKDEMERKQKEYIRLAVEMSKKAKTEEVTFSDTRTVTEAFTAAPADDTASAIEVSEETITSDNTSVEAVSDTEQEAVTVNGEEVEEAINIAFDESITEEKTEATADTDNEEVTESIQESNEALKSADEVFTNVFMSEEEAEEKANEIAKTKESMEVPDFESYIRNHNKSIGSESPDNSGNNSEKKGGQSYS